MRKHRLLQHANVLSYAWLLLMMAVHDVDGFAFPQHTSSRRIIHASSSSSSSSTSTTTRLHVLQEPKIDSNRSSNNATKEMPIKIQVRPTTTTSAAAVGNNNNNNNNIPEQLRIQGRGIPSRKDNIQLLESSTYESSFIKNWEEDPSLYQTGFDWEIEKLRRYFAGLRMRDDGNWVRQPSFLDFLVTKSSNQHAGSDNNGAPTPVGMVDVAKLTMANILVAVGMGSSLGMAAVPTAEIPKYEGTFWSYIKGVIGGDLQTLANGPLFLLLAKFFQDYGPIFNLAFGPKAFLVVSDPVMARHVLREVSPDHYCKGMLAEILEPIMGKGLIPADPKTWKVRRRAIVPGFHKKWLNRMITMFADRGDILVNDLIVKVKKQQNSNTNDNLVVDMEERFCSVALDIIGKAVFNYDFGSVTKESPVVKSVYRVLREAEHRSSSFIPYWNLPYADQWMGGQVEFREDMTMLDDILANLINEAVSTREEATVEELEERDNADDPSLLRFLVDMRGEDLSSMVLRDDLMTMLIAGHETTAAMLTWTLFELSRGDPGLLREVQAEVRTILHNKNAPDYDDIVAMKKLRYSLIESLRLYPEPPVLIRRARSEDTLPAGGTDMKNGVKVLRGTDMFISTWNLHRSPELWENPETFDPTRWDRAFKNPSVKGWAGYDPSKVTGLYPNEVAADFAFLPFGGGQRKCVGDQFAMMEAAVTMAMMIKNFDFDFAIAPEDVGMKTGATIHTMRGLLMTPRPVSDSSSSRTATANGSSSSTSSTDGWWVKQHLKRGLNADGRPFLKEEKQQREGFDVASGLEPTTPNVSGRGGCPVDH